MNGSEDVLLVSMPYLAGEAVSTDFFLSFFSFFSFLASRSLSLAETFLLEWCFFSFAGGDLLLLLRPMY